MCIPSTIYSITFFGLQLTGEGVSPAAENVQGLHEATPPTNVSETQSFPGLVGFSGPFIPNLSTLAEPLRQGCRTGATFQWGTKQQEVVQTLKDLLAAATSLAYCDVSARTEVIADARSFGLGLRSCLSTDSKGLVTGRQLCYLLAARSAL